MKVQVHRLTAELPRSEIFGSASQMWRAAASVAANIAERFGRSAREAFAQARLVFQGSSKERENRLPIGNRVCYITHEYMRMPLAMTWKPGTSLGSLLRTLSRTMNSEQRMIADLGEGF